MILTCCLFLSVFVCNSFGAKLTTPRILLPYNTGVPTNYSLEVKEGSCYKWSSSRYDIVSVTPLPDERESESCTTRAVVSAISRYPERGSAIILAEDERSGQVLRCDIHIDALYSIEIVTTTRVLYLEDAPEVFEVIAKNDQEDTFSSLGGVAFQWALESSSFENDVYGVLRFLKFADSEYKTPLAVGYWEKQNLHGSMILMEGSKTGTAKVTVKPMDPAYKHIKPHEVRLIVVANLNLKPSPIHLLPGTKIKYHLELLKQGKSYPVFLPSEKYFLEVNDSAVAQLESSTSVLTAHSYGTTNVVVKDKSITDREHDYLPKAIVHVTVPFLMTLSIFPGDKWSLQEEKNYSVSVNIYDRDGYPIHITEEVNVAVSFPPKYFRVISSTKNGTYHEVFTLVPGACQIDAKLIGVRKVKTEAHVSTSQDVAIYEKIMVLPRVSLLPWDPTKKPYYNIFLKASGGTGSYNWMSSNPSLAAVDNILLEDRQKTRVKTFGQGEVTIHATDSHISLFTASAVVSVQSAFEMKLFPKEVEVHVNETLQLPVAMYGFLKPGHTEKRLFSDCIQLPLSVHIDEIAKFEHIKDDLASSNNACRNLHLNCLTVGYNRIRVRYEYEDTLLKDSVIVACYKRLKAIHPKTEAVVAIGSSVDVVFEGGPKPWVTCKGNYYTKLTEQNPYLDTAFRSNATDSSGNAHLLQSLCKGYGDEDVELTVGNRPCPENRHPISNIAAAKVICALPQTLIIKPIISTLASKKCPAPIDDIIAVHNKQDVQLELIVKDGSGRNFYNISSLEVKWSLSNKSLAYLDNYDGFQTKLMPQKYDYRTIESDYRILHPQALEGKLKVTAVILGYKPEVSQKISIPPKPEFPLSISHTLNLNLVEEVDVLPKRISIFNNPATKGYLNVSKGSGYFQIDVSDKTKAKAIYKESSRQVEVVPLDTGNVTVTIIDLCIPMKQESVTPVHIYGISAIVLDVVDKVELGKHVTASVEVLSEDKQNIPTSVFALINLQPVVSSDIISVRLVSKPTPDLFSASYHVNGVVLGQTNLKFITSSTALKGHQYSTESHPIQVFPPLQIVPRNFTLVIGATFQVTCVGGPHPQSSIEYAIAEPDKAFVSTGGKVEARKLGMTALIASSVGHDKRGHVVVFSTDKVFVHVISLHRVKIHSPLTRMIVGSEMPVYAVGLSDEETPFTFGSAYPALEFKWSVSNERIVTVRDVYQEVGIEQEKENNFCARVEAQQDGHVTLRMDVIQKDQTTGGNRPIILSDEVQIQVLKKLQLINPEYNDGMILLSPHSQLKLQCNRFAPAKLVYSITIPEGEDSAMPVAKVDNLGMLTAFSKIGTAALTVISHEEFGITQHLTVIVKVENVAYMMLKPTAKIKTRDWPIVSVPVGFTVPFEVTYHDNLGRIFHAVRSQMKFRANRLDLSRISAGSKNNTLSVQVLKAGLTVLKVWDSESLISPDFVKISGNFAIDPTDAQVIMGDVICFGSPLLTHEGYSGTWTSESNLIAVHHTSGGAVALLPGSASVAYMLSSEFSTSVKVVILPVDKILINAGNLQYFTNVLSDKPYKIPVFLQSANTYRTRNIVGRNCSGATTEESLPLPPFRVPFSCDISFDTLAFDIRATDVFYAESQFSIVEGMYFCLLYPKKNVLPVEVSTVDAHLIISIHLLSLGHEFSATTEPLKLPFLPAFTVNEEKVTLTSFHVSQTFSVSASGAVRDCIEAVSSNKDLVSVLPPVTRDSSLVYPVRLIDAPQSYVDSTPLYIEILCKKTRQIERLPVIIKILSVNFEGGQCLLPSSSSYTQYDWQFIFSVAGSVIVILCLVYVCRSIAMSKRVTVTTQPVFLNSSHNGSFNISQRGLSPSPPKLSQSFQSRSPSPDVAYESLVSLRRTPPMWSQDSPHQMRSRRRPVNIFQ